MNSLCQAVDKYRHMKHIEMEFVLKNINGQKFDSIVNLLKTKNLKYTSTDTVDNFTDTGLRITGDKIINKVIKTKVDCKDFCFNVKAELPVQMQTGTIVKQRTKSRMTFCDKYIRIDATHIKEDSLYEIEIEIDPIQSLSHSAEHIVKKCIKYLESFGAYV